MDKKTIEDKLKNNRYIEMYDSENCIDIIYNKNYQKRYKYFLVFNGINIKSGFTLKPIYNKLKKMNISLYSLNEIEV